MGLFKALVKVVVEVPLSAGLDILTMGGAMDDNGQPHIKDAYDSIMDEL